MLPFFIPTYVPIFNRTLLSWLVNFSIPSAICTEPVTHFTPIVILAGNFCTRKMLCKISDFATNPALCTTTVHFFVLFSLYCHGMEGRFLENFCPWNNSRGPEQGISYLFWISGVGAQLCPPWPPLFLPHHAIFKVNRRDKSKKWIIKSKWPAVC